MIPQWAKARDGCQAQRIISRAPSDVCETINGDIILNHILGSSMFYDTTAISMI